MYADCAAGMTDAGKMRPLSAYKVLPERGRNETVPLLPFSHERLLP